MKIKSSFLKLEDGKLYYETAGSGEPMIFIHADTLDTRQWQEQMKYFSKSYQTISFDLRSFGKSSLPTNNPYSFVEDLHSLIVGLGLQKVILVGLSLGADVAVNFALEHPEKMKKLIVADAGVAGLKYSEQFYKDINSILDSAKKGDLESAKSKWSSLPVFNYSLKNKEVAGKIKEMVDKTSGYRWYGKNQPYQKYPDTSNHVNIITAPTLIMYGENDADDFINVCISLH